MMPDQNQLLAFFWSGWTATWPTQLLALIWIGWLVSWAAGSFFSARTEKHVRTWDSRAYRVPIFVGAVLLTPWTARILGEHPLWHAGVGGTYLLAGLTLAGTLFTWWARIHLGRFWSNAITRKEGHRVIDTGPYGLVRHPIYTGLIGAMLATAIAVGTVTALIGALLIAFGLWQKARMEEGFLSAELGADAYGPYCRRVPMLIPFLPPRRPEIGRV
ncbi:methyltransferase family protein [Bradyrhizobium sp.]|jgi:protein-S-isoprenylcysteine O-methyltransferase Ste14|uniref:methyltransferase family protein n=1 Tax=Bradyrhizobium sp. TaxID=376 RepID=UPI003C1A2763